MCIRDRWTPRVRLGGAQCGYSSLAATRLSCGNTGRRRGCVGAFCARGAPLRTVALLFFHRVDGRRRVEGSAWRRTWAAARVVRLAGPAKVEDAADCAGVHALLVHVCAIAVEERIAMRVYHLSEPGT